MFVAISGSSMALFAANTRWYSPWWARVCSTRMFRAILKSKFRATGSEQLEILLTDGRLLDTDIRTILESKFQATGRGDGYGSLGYARSEEREAAAH